MFYGPDQAIIHHREFTGLADAAASHLLGLLAARGLHGSVVDLGCGSGVLARRLTDAGYDVTGFDLSESMVALAREHAPRARFTAAALLDAALPSPCVAVAATGEVLNYGTDPRTGLDAMARLAVRVHEAVVPGGLWLFDVAGPGRGGPGRRVEVFHRHDDWCLGVVATESEDGRRLDRAITIFTAAETGGYQRADEDHVLRLYSETEVRAVLERAGFEVEVIAGYEAPDGRVQLSGWYVVQAWRTPVGVG